MARDDPGAAAAPASCREHVAALTRHHLRLGFLVHECRSAAAPSTGYLHATEPVEVDVTCSASPTGSATRGRNADEAIASAPGARARDARPTRCAGARDARPAPLVRGDELAQALGIEPGPAARRVLAQIAEAASFAGRSPRATRRSRARPLRDRRRLKH